MDPCDNMEMGYRPAFIKMVDELVRDSECDNELSDGIKWLDYQAREKGIGFYDMIFNVLEDHYTRKEASEWLKERSADVGYKNRN